MSVGKEVPRFVRDEEMRNSFMVPALCHSLSLCSKVGAYCTIRLDMRAGSITYITKVLVEMLIPLLNLLAEVVFPKEVGRLT
jgi:hypothetical protein